MNTTLPDSPKIGAIACRLGIQQAHALGLVLTVWAWADSATADGFIPFATREMIDRRAGESGVCDAMQAVGWVVVTEGGVLLSDWGKYNGNGTKSRMSATSRQQRCRASVTVERDKSVTTEQNRTEQNRTAAASKHAAAVGGAAAVVLTDEEIRQRQAYLRRRPEWLPDGKPWIEPDVIAELAAMPGLDNATVEGVYRVARDGRLTMKNPAGLIVKRLRAAGGAR